MERHGAVRLARLDGGTLVLSSRPQPDPIGGRIMVAELRWERAAAPGAA